MSGGRFDYNQYRIRDIASEISKEIYNSGRNKTEREINEEKKDYYWDTDREIDPKMYEYPTEVIEEFKKGYEIMRLAEIYAQRIDWLLSGDDGDESFIKRLKSDKDILDLELKHIKEEGFKFDDYYDPFDDDMDDFIRDWH